MIHDSIFSLLNNNAHFGKSAQLSVFFLHSSFIFCRTPPPRPLPPTPAPLLSPVTPPGPQIPSRTSTLATRAPATGASANAVTAIMRGKLRCPPRPSSRTPAAARAPAPERVSAPRGAALPLLLPTLQLLQGHRHLHILLIRLVPSCRSQTTPWCARGRAQ